MMKKRHFFTKKLHFFLLIFIYNLPFRIPLQSINMN